MSNEQDELPEDWKWVRIADVCETTSGGTPSRQQAEYFGGGIPWVKSGELEDGLIRETEETITKQGLANSSAKVFPAGTPLVALYGATVGRTALLGIDAATNQAVCALFPEKTTLSPHYLLRYLQSQRQNLIEVSIGGAQPNISQKIVRDWPLPLPPLDEQHRIVAKIERLFAESRTAREALDGVPALIKRFRQSVLAKAFRGELTECDPGDEPASALLERIRAERRAKSKKNIEPEPPDINGLPELPEGWEWTSVGQAGDVVGGIQKTPARTPKNNAFPYLRVANVLRGQLNLSAVYQFELQAGELERWRLESGDVLIVEGNGSLNEIGRCALWHGEIPDCVHQNHIIRVRFESGIDPNYFHHYLNSTRGIDAITSVASSTSGLYTLSVSKVQRIGFPVCPLAEQRRIVAKIEALFAQADAIADAVNIARRRAEKVDQAILARAFRGEL